MAAVAVILITKCFVVLSTDVDTSARVGYCLGKPISTAFAVVSFPTLYFG